MASSVQSLDVSFAWLLYGVHMVSLPFWLGTGAWALRKVRAARKAASQPAGAVKAATAPTQGEYFAVHLLAFYAAADALRGLDLCFEGSDGSCRAVWGVVPLGLRMSAWAVRDAALLGAIGLYLDFLLGWTHGALGWQPPRAEQMRLRGALAVAMCGIAGSFWAMCATNRQSWQAIAVLFVILLNVVWIRTNLRLLRSVMPQVEDRFALAADKSLDLRSEGEANASGTVAPWVWAAAAEGRLAVRLILAANICILALFPLCAADRLLIRGAHWLPTIPEFPVGSWVAGAPMPRLSELPLDTSLTPSLEVVELTIGWLQWVYVLSAARKPASARPPKELEDSGRGYVSSLALGDAIRTVGKLGKCT